ncbi:3-deoxy-D-manno-octulosonate 8-phosphate phosphatase [Mergibacter septicus]|uniref:KdsC family phosphatase n=1 Tax=Mergibacter septicus TaxID=221402 RepID=UPI0011792D99|nr:HAD hydrolase family protein [Mergibacter septicus]AWX13199.1 3-deoxy-D-manno-octulosonate 8-phosphate phosphatase [Mergibacter septicus]
MQAKLSKIKLVITDVDGVLTDGSLYYGADDSVANAGVEILKVFNARDGLGTKMLLNNGVQVAILSGRDSKVLRKRIADLGISLFSLGKLDKQTACLDLIEQAGVTAEETVFLGDDSIDLPAFEICGLAYAVADAADYIKVKADGVLSKAGGKGAFRELVDLILTAQGKANVFTTAEGFLSSANKMKQ